MFGSSHFQVQGVAMGTKCAPSYANLYLRGWERELFDNTGSSNLLQHVISWHRYIDDVLFFWSGTRDELSQFIDFLAINDYNLRFTMECSLDLEISIDSEGRLYSTLYCKPLSGNTILHARSAHPKPLWDSISYNQYLRIKRNCTLEADFQKASRDLYHRLKNRGYSHFLLTRKSL